METDAFLRNLDQVSVLPSLPQPEIFVHLYVCIFFTKNS